ncbi:MAG: hypothetical protein JW725_00600, partial [Candidatus Babeliaceae bacterium]|nr:hypothetical protein [Candidatus Babeliaceae bacterium]
LLVGFGHRPSRVPYSVKTIQWITLVVGLWFASNMISPPQPLSECSVLENQQYSPSQVNRIHPFWFAQLFDLTVY